MKRKHDEVTGITIEEEKPLIHDFAPREQFCSGNIYLHSPPLAVPYKIRNPVEFDPSGYWIWNQQRLSIHAFWNGREFVDEQGYSLWCPPAIRQTLPDYIHLDVMFYPQTDSSYRVNRLFDLYAD